MIKKFNVEHSNKRRELEFNWFVKNSWQKKILRNSLPLHYIFNFFIALIFYLKYGIKSQLVVSVRSIIISASSAK